MKKLIFVIAFLLIAITSLSLPARSNAAFSFISFQTPNSVKVAVNTELTPGLLKVIFTNTYFARKISYTLTYDHSLGTEGVIGEFKPKGIKPISKIIKLATCSAGGTCVSHSEISNMTLTVTTKYNFFGTETVTYSIN